MKARTIRPDVCVCERPGSVELSVVPEGDSSWKWKRRVVFPEHASAITLVILDKGTAWLS